MLGDDKIKELQARKLSEPETPAERKHRKLRQNNQTRTFLNGRAKAIRRGRGRR